MDLSFDDVSINVIGSSNVIVSSDDSFSFYIKNNFKDVKFYDRSASNNTQFVVEGRNSIFWLFSK